ncbi:MAG: leukotoxin LktA family filamentous adhesin, partial [Pyramidobacter sp.]|nr:leukotoxin LktA family filamentous adhesin [Pyramidobacter sp.]
MSKKSIRKENKRKAELKLLSSALAFGLMFLDPAEAAVSHSITRSGAAPAGDSVSGKTTNLYAAGRSGKVGINRFSTFNVGNGHVANMHFKHGSAAGETVDKLVNLVDSKINVDGVVNGVKNGKVDGDLFFLSKDGMAVGKTGRINAGSLTVLTPTQAEMDAMADDAAVANKITNPDGIALNPSGTITVAGKISTKGSVKLRAGKVAVGKDANNKAVADAAIETGVTDFGSLVNLDGAGEAVTSGLENLTASAMADGTITLASMNADENVTAQTATLKNATKLVSAAGARGKVALKGYRGNDFAELPLDALDKKGVTYDFASLAPTTGNSSVSKTKIGTTEHEGTVSLYAQRKASGNNIAVSNYEHFAVKQGDTVNLFYRTSDQDTDDAAYLVNLVDNKILIDGTVSGKLKSGATGGKLFFLSSNGMAVGASGSINAGSVGLLMPSWAEMQVLRVSSDATDFAKYTTAIDTSAIPVSANGAISVAGHVTADGGDVTMFGSEIAVDGTIEAGGSITLSVAAPLRSGWLDGRTGVASDIVHDILGNAEGLTWAVDFLADIFDTVAPVVQEAIAQAQALAAGVPYDPAATATQVSLGISSAELNNILGAMTGEYAVYRTGVSVGQAARLEAGGALTISARAENRVPTALTKVESIVNIDGFVQGSTVNVDAVATARSAAGFMPNLKTGVTAKVNVGAQAKIKATGAAGENGTGGVILNAEASALGGLTAAEIAEAVQSGTLGEFDTANGQRFISDLVAEINVADGAAEIASENGDVT